MDGEKCNAINRNLVAWPAVYADGAIAAAFAQRMAAAMTPADLSITEKLG